MNLRTEQIGDGIVAGTQVRLDGVLVGEVGGIEPADRGTQRITLRLDGSRLRNIDASLGVDYAPANLFGISEVGLRRGPGGPPLHDGASLDLTGARAGAVYDATLGALIRSLSTVTTDVLTPNLVTLLDRLARDVGAFTPFLQAVVETFRTVAAVQKYDPSYLMRQYGAALAGGAPFVAATATLIEQINTIEVLRTDREHFDATVGAVVDRLFPAVSSTMNRAGAHLDAYTSMLVPLLSALAPMVAHPQRSSAQLRELLERLGATLPNTPDGPKLNLDVELRSVPAVSVPLLGTGAR